MDKKLKEQLETLATKIEAKRQHACSSCDLEEHEWTAIDSYNKALTEAAEIVRATIKKAV